MPQATQGTEPYEIYSPPLDRSTSVELLGPRKNSPAVPPLSNYAGKSVGYAATAAEVLLASVAAAVMQYVFQERSGTNT